MTEQQVETTESQVEEKPVFPDEMAELSFKTLSDLIANRNSEVGKVNAVKGDRQTLTEQIEAQSTKPEIVEARERVAKIQEALDEAVMALHAVVTPEVNSLLEDAESSVKDTEAKVKEYDEKIKPGLKYFKKMYGENLAKHLPALARLKGFSTKGAGATGRRVRGFDVAVTIDGETTAFENMAQAAKYLEVETATLQEAFFKASGKESLKDVGDRVDFNVTFTEVDEAGAESENTAQVVATRTVKHDEAEASDEAEADESTED